MNVFGVGAWELVAILLIMLVFAGPKRMIHWSYVLGQHVSKFRKIWSETVDLVQKEFDDAGVDIKLPKEPPTRGNLNRSLTDAVKPMTKPVQDSLDEVKSDMNVLQEVSDELNEKKPKSTSAAAKPEAPSTSPVVKMPAKPKTQEASAPSMRPEPVKLGSWSGDSPANTSDNGSSVDLGTWSNAAEAD
ncbi:MAG: hypothetical protein OXI30_18915 [Chloroflexota bacterium]|nr:hypothetical protein [Chloroflexota bacterium]